MWRLTACLVGLAAAWGCGGAKSGGAPQEPTHWLQMVNEEEANGPLRIVSASPQGKADSSLPISVVFSHPMRPLGLAEHATLPPIQIEPLVPGGWQWVGSNAVTLVGPTALLVPATTYRVTVSGAARDVLGRNLGMPYVYQFETERPKLLSVTGRRALDSALSGEPLCAYFNRADASSRNFNERPDEPPLALDEHLLVQFNLPMDPTTLMAQLKLSSAPRGEGVGEAIDSMAFDLSSPCPETPQLVELVPKRPLPKGSKIRVVTGAGMKAAVGDLTAGETFTATQDTYGPLAVGVQYAPIMGCQGVLVNFSNRVTLDAVRRSLSIRPRLKFSVEESVIETSACVNGKFDQTKPYIFAFDGRLRDNFGQPLTGAHEIEMVFSSEEREFGIGAVKGSIQDPKSLHIPMQAQWVDKLRTKVVALTPQDILRFYEQQPSEEGFSDLLEAMPGKSTTHFLGKRHWSGAVSLVDALGQSPFGSFGLLTQLDDEPVSAGLLHATDLAVVAILSTKQGLVWVNRRSTGQPVPGARLSIHTAESGGKPLAQTTDQDGIALLDEASVAQFVTPKQRPLMAVEAGADSTYVNSRRLESVTDELPITGSVFVDRGIYRPGDPIHVKGWLWQQTEFGSQPLVGAKVELRLYHRQRASSDRDLALLKSEVESNAFGGFTAQWQLPKDAPLDEYYVVVTVGERHFQTELRVGEYRPVEYSAKADAEVREVTLGDEAKFRVRGTYLLGSPTRGAKVAYSLERRRVHANLVEGFVTDAFRAGMFSPRGALLSGDPRQVWPDFGVLAPSSRARGGARSSGVEKLDAEGQARLRVRAMGFPDGPADLELVAEVSDSSQQVVGASATLRVHPASFYLGVRIDENTAQLGRPLVAQVIAVSPDARRLGGKSARVELWSHTSTEEGVEPRSNLVGSCEVKTDANNVARCAVTPKSVGPHSLLVTGRDEHHRVMRAGKQIWVVGTKNAPVAPATVSEPTLDLDRDVYRVGEVLHASILVPNPRATLLVSLETNRMLWWKRFTPTSRHFALDIPIPKEVVRNAAVVLSVVAPPVEKRWPDDKLRRHVPPFLQTASAEFSIDPELQRLRVEVQPAETSVTPGGNVRVALKVTDQQGLGREAEVALLAVDEGVLNLTGYRVHDPLVELLGERPQSVSHLDSQSSGELFISVGTGASMRLKPGECGPFGNCQQRTTPLDASRHRFPGTVYFNPSIVTKSDGTAAVEVPLGDAVTSYRLMAAAVSQHGQAGASSAVVATRQPLMLRSALPRLLRVGDRVEAGVIAMNETERELALTIALTTKGIEPSKSPSKAVVLAAKSSKHLTFGLTATAPGTAAFRFDASGDSIRDSVTVNVPIVAPLPLQTVAAYGSTKTFALEQLGDLTMARQDSGKLEIKVSSTALLGVERGLEQMGEQDWPNSEQLVSRLLPELLLGDLERAFGLQPRLTRKQLQDGLRSLLGFQNGLGGIGLWDGNSEPHPWVSAYALLVLTRAADQGLIAAPMAIQQLERFVAGLLDRSDDEVLSASSIFAAYVLSQKGTVPWDKLVKFWNTRATLPLFSKSLLLEAISNQQPTAEKLPARQNMMKTLTDELVASLHFDGPRLLVASDNDRYRSSFNSGTRSTAMVLSALLAVEPRHPLAAKLVHSLLAARGNGTWRSTQESAFALLALDRYRRLREAVPPQFDAKLWLGDRLLGAYHQQGTSLRVERFDVPMHDLVPKGTSIRFALEGTGELHYETRLSYVPNRLPVAPLDRGFFLTQRLTPFRMDGSAEPNASPSTEFALGDVVEGEVILATPTRRDYLRLDVPIPAGMELIDSQLETTPAEGKAFGGRGAQDPHVDGKLEYMQRMQKPHPLPKQPTASDLTPKAGYASRRELRDDRVRYYIDRMEPGAYRYRYRMRATSAGRFVLPPSVAQELYAPEVMGRTAATAVVIR